MSMGGAALQHRALVQKTLVRLRVTFASQQRLDALAADVGASVFHLCRIFRRHTGLTINQYRHHLRLMKARALLEHSNDDILTIAVALGYSGHSHFTGAFHRRFGVTPSAFRGSIRSVRPASVAGNTPDDRGVAGTC